MYKRNIPMTI